MEGNSSVKMSNTPETKIKVPLEEMTREDLIAQVKRQLVFLQKAKAKCDGLTSRITLLQTREEENESLKKKCLELESVMEKNAQEKVTELDKLRDDYIKVQKDKLALEEQIQCLTMKNTTLSEMCQSFQVEISDLNKSKKEDKDQMNILKEARDAALNSIRDLKSMLKEKDARNLSLESELESSKERGVKLLEKFETLIQEMDSLTSQNISLQDDYNEIKRQLKMSIDECDNWKAKVEELENEKEDYVGPTVDISELQYKVEELEQELEVISQEKIQLSEENSILASRLEEMERNSTLIEESNRKIDEYDSQSLRQIAIYLDQIRSLEEDLLKTTNQKEDLSEELEQVRDLQRFLEDETKELREECRYIRDSFEERLKEYSGRVSSLDKKLSESEEKEKEYHRDIQLMETQFQELSREYEGKIESLQNELDRLKKDLEEAKKETDDQNQTDPSCLVAVEGEVRTKSFKEFKMDEFETLTESSDQNREDTSKINELNETLNEKTALVESIHQKMDDLINQIDELNSIISEKEADIDSLADKLRKYRQEIDEKDDRIKILTELLHQKELEESRGEIEGMKKDPEESEKMIDQSNQELQESKKGIEVELKELKKLFEESKEEFEQSKKELEEEKERLKKEFEQSKKELVEEREGLKKELGESKTEFEQSKKELEEEREGLKKELGESKTEFEQSKKELEEEREGLKKELGESKTEFEQSKKELEEEREGLKKELGESKTEFEQSKKELEEEREGLKRELGESTKRFEETKKEFEQSNKKLEDSKKEIEVELEGLKKDFEKSEKRLEETQKELEESKKELEGLKKELEESKKKMEEREEMKKELDELREVFKDRQRLSVLYDNLLKTYNDLFHHSRSLEEKQSCLIRRLELEESLREFCAELEFRLNQVISERDNLVGHKIVQEDGRAMEGQATLGCEELTQKLEENALEITKEREIDSRKNLSDLESKVSEMRNEIDSLIKERAELFDELERYKTALTDASDRDLKNESLVKGLTLENKKLKTEFSNLESKLEQFEELRENLAIARKENDKLVTAIDENESKLDLLKKECSNAGKKIEELSETLSLAQNENSTLKERLRENLVKEEDKLKSASVVEDSANKELTGSKEKIEKLKKVVFRLKKELADTQKHLTEAKSVKEELSNLSLCHLQNFQSLQAEYDKLQDDYEAIKDENKKLNQDIRSKVSEVVSLKEELEREKSEKDKLRASLENEKREKKKMEEAKAERESLVIILKSEKEAEKKKWMLAQNDIKKLENQISSLEGKLKSEKDAHNQTVQKMEELTKAAKKHDVLNLEINDYETTIYNMEEKINEKDQRINELQKEIDSNKEKELFLKDEIERLNSQRLTEEYRLENLKDILEKTKNELAEKCSTEKELSSKLEDSRLELEKMKSDREERQIRLSEMTNKISFLERALKNSKENYSKSFKSYEAQVAHLEQELSASRAQVEMAGKEFESYKVRVHSVLKQKQTPLAASPSQIEDKERMEKTLENYREKLESLSDELNVKNVELETSQREHSLLISKIDKLTAEIKLKDEYWTQKYEELVKERESSRAAWESERNRIAQQKELLITSFKSQIESLKEEGQLSMDSLQRQLDAYEREIITLRQKEQQQAQQQKTIAHDETSFDVSSLERQEGEGSECTESLDLNSSAFKPLSLNMIPSSGFTPLEQLLRSNPETSPPSSPLDITTLSNDISVARRKIDHLVELLNESEANNMKLSEQVRLLKDEIRRLERNKEREEIISNLEYLKNVVIKFITLQEGSERERLVPVLTTMLKLSSEEHNHIQQVASGQYLNAANNAGWSSYLQWSGLV